MTTTLPAPYYADGQIVIYHGDCLELLPLIEPKTVDLVLTDPPYGLGFRGAAWDADIPDWLPLARALSETVVFTTSVLSMWHYPQPDWVLCYASPGSTSRAPSGGFNHWWPVLVYGRVKYPVDLLSLPRVSHLAPTWNTHPTPKPERLMRWLLTHASTEGDLVVDPFMGSGTTLRAAKDLGRRAIGIDREAWCCELAVMRLRQTTLPFGAVPEAPARQTALV